MPGLPLEADAAAAVATGVDEHAHKDDKMAA